MAENLYKLKNLHIKCRSKILKEIVIFWVYLAEIKRMENYSSSSTI